MSRYLVNLKKGNDYLVPNVCVGIDTTNLLSNGNSTYTATQDCWCLLSASREYNNVNAGLNIKIDGLNIFEGNATFQLSGFIRVNIGAIFIKSGQTITISGWNNNNINIFGLKY